MSKNLAIGIDLGGTKIASTLIDKSGEILTTSLIATHPERGPQSVIDDIVREINSLSETARLAGETVQGIGIGTPGQVNSEAGTVTNAVNLGWTHVELVKEIQRRLPKPVPIFIQKDANASTLGEHYLGAGRGHRDFVFLTIGSGLGGGLLVNGRLVTGSNWNAAEVGHIVIDPDGRKCACGLRGCAETVVSGPGLLAVTQELLSDGKYSNSRLRAGATLNTTGVIASIRSGDPLARAAINEVGRWLGIVAASCVTLLNPSLLVLGGGIGLAAFEFLQPVVKAEIEKRVLAASTRDLKILPSLVASSATGPACLVWYGLEGS